VRPLRDDAFEIVLTRDLEKIDAAAVKLFEQANA
jgi:hypothetical protein